MILLLNLHKRHIRINMRMHVSYCRNINFDMRLLILLLTAALRLFIHPEDIKESY